MFSLRGPIQGSKIDQAWAQQLESDRFLSGHNMVCPTPSGTDSTGRPAQVFTGRHGTRTAGCQSALDQVDIETNLRPSYAEFVTLNAAGIAGVGPTPSREAFVQYGGFGQQLQSKVRRGMNPALMRQAQALAARSNQARAQSGF